MDEKKGSSNPDPNVATEKCVSLQASVNDYWCSTECSNGACPKHLCVCGAEAEEASVPPLSAVAAHALSARHEAAADASKSGRQKED